MQKLECFGGLGVTQGHRKHRYLIEPLYQIAMLLERI